MFTGGGERISNSASGNVGYNSHAAEGRRLQESSSWWEELDLLSLFLNQVYGLVCAWNINKFMDNAVVAAIVYVWMDLDSVKLCMHYVILPNPDWDVDFDESVVHVFVEFSKFRWSYFPFSQ